MLQRFEIVDIPVVDAPDQARELLHRFAYTDLPALAIRNTGANTVQEAVAGISADLPAGVESDPVTTEFWFGNTAGLGHIGIHHDHDLPVIDEVEIPVTYHLTESGVAVASLFGPGTRFMERAALHGPDKLSLEERNRQRLGMEAALKDGVIDPELADPTCHRTTLTEGTLLVFKSGQPYWHIMDTQGPGRKSAAYDSWMAVQPGMKLQHHEPAPRSDFFDLDDEALLAG